MSACVTRAGRWTPRTARAGSSVDVAAEAAALRRFFHGVVL